MTPEIFLGGKVVLHAGDSRSVLQSLAACSIDSIVTDPPYALVSIVKRFGAGNAAAVKVPEGGSGAYARASAGFMGKQWDTGETAFAATFWAECLRVLKPGGHVVAFSGTRTYHRMACAIEDAGFEVRDMLSWLYGSGFPKSHDVSKGIDRAAGEERPVVGQKQAGMGSGKTFGMLQAEGNNASAGHTIDVTAPATITAAQWQGWGTALKPACEPILLGRKPLIGTVAANVLAHGTGAINVDGCRITASDKTQAPVGIFVGSSIGPSGHSGIRDGSADALGRWPANVLHDGSAEVLAGFPESKSGGNLNGSEPSSKTNSVYGNFADRSNHGSFHDDGSAARFFYTSKADSDDRLGSKHPTVKPLDLLQWLCRLITPPGGTILDPFSGTGTTGEAAFREGFNAVLIEREEEYQNDIRRRMRLVMGGPDERARESIKARQGDALPDHGPLFGGLDTPPYRDEPLDQQD